MNEHDLYVRLQKYIESLKSQIEGLVKERDLLLEDKSMMAEYIKELETSIGILKSELGRV